MDPLSDNAKKSSKNFSPKSKDNSNVKENLAIPAESVKAENTLETVQGLTESTSVAQDDDKAVWDFILNFEEQGIKIYRKQREDVIKNKKKSFYINWNHLYTWFEQHKDKYPMNLAIKLLAEPLTEIPRLSGLVYDAVMANNIRREGEEEKPELELNEYAKAIDKPDFHVRITNIPRKIELRKVRTEFIKVGELIEIKGIVVSKTLPKQKLVKGTYRHLRYDCSAEFTFPNDEIEELEITPHRCPLCGKKGEIVLIPEKSVYTGWQKVIIRETSEEIPPGETPQEIELELLDDLVDAVRIGDKIEVVGIKTVKQPKIVNGKLVSDPYVKVISIKVLESSITDYEISEEDEQKIRELAKRQDIVDLIVKSIAPSVYGLEFEKEGIALSLFGGVPKVKKDGTRRRGGINGLIIGDPGTAKSQLLQFVKKLMPRAIFVDGKNTTGVGLTASVVMDQDTKEWRVDAGAFALADNGFVLIDEFDKIPEEDREAINTVMEQQVISVHKADKHVELDARATVIAVANPRFKRYIKDRTVAENINFKPDMLSRFDWISIIVDEPNEEQDRKLAEHINSNELGNEEADNSVIDVDTLRKYIIYARKNIKPELPKEALDTLKEFFVTVRNKTKDLTDFPLEITARQYEALLRISQAYAKMRLSNQVETQDVERAIKFVSEMLRRFKADIETGVTQDIMNKMIRILDLITALSSSPVAGAEGCAKLGDILLNAEEQFGIDPDTITRLIDLLRQQGQIREVKENCYKRG